MNSRITGQICFNLPNFFSKKAIKRESNKWLELLGSVLIAFFIVVSSALSLNFIFNTLEKNNPKIDNIKTQSSEERFFSPELFLALNFLNIPVTQAADLDYQGMLEKGTYYISLEAGKEATLRVKIQNIGAKMWNKGEVTLETGLSLRSFSQLQSSNWVKYYRPAVLDKTIKPKDSVELSFNLKAPNNFDGEIQSNFQLVANGLPVSGTLFRVFAKPIVKNQEVAGVNVIKQPIVSASTVSTKTVTTITKQTASKVIDTQVDKAIYCISGASKTVNDHEVCQTDPHGEGDISGIITSIKLNSEPNIRVGLFNTSVAQRISSNVIYDVYGGATLLMSALQPNQIITVSFDFKTQQYIVSGHNLTKFVNQPIRLVPQGQNGIFTLLDYNHAPAWNKNLNDNQFRNIIEFNHSAVTKKLWVINELPIEQYLKGLAETSNYSPVEYQKVIATAARTYALYHYQQGVLNGIADASTKHKVEHFHVDSLYDQVYRGYGSEVRLTKLSQAVEETRGVVVTYQNNIVVTPYFSTSDGRTRNWSQVWGGADKPWIKSVLVPEDSGKTLFGHGVGLSANAAFIMTSENGKTWQEVLKYFYNNIDLQKVYN